MKKVVELGFSQGPLEDHIKSIVSPEIIMFIMIRLCQQKKLIYHSYNEHDKHQNTFYELTKSIASTNFWHKFEIVLLP